MKHLATFPLNSDRDVVLVRQGVRVACERLGFEDNVRTRIATAVSEVARNAIQHGFGGEVRLGLRVTEGMALVIAVSDRGPGIPDDVWSGRRGGGLLAARKLVDTFERSSEGGNTVTLTRAVGRQVTALTDAAIAALATELLSHDAKSAHEELVRQNRELADALATLRLREEELERLNRELADMNSGVLVLYTELEEQTLVVRRAGATKERFYSEMNHELRTPLNAIINLADILADGTLDAEAQKVPLTYLRKSARQMSELVDDLLDLARVEAGKMTLRVTEFSVADFLGALRGIFRPLHTNVAVELTFDDGADAGTMRSDEGKLAQILRNFVSNALKFTETGTVGVRLTALADSIRFDVVDSGIGIAPEDQARLFEAFARVESAKARPTKGTGLGLTVSRRLAQLLGGRVELRSTPGVGSTFSVTVPRALPSSIAEPATANAVVLIDDDEVARYLLKEMLRPLQGALFEASSGAEGLALVRAEKPALIFLDLNMPDMSGHAVLDALEADPELRTIPVIVNTSEKLTANEHTELARRTLGILSKDGNERQATVKTLEKALAKVGLR